MMPTTRILRTLAAAAATLALVALGACGGDDDETAATTATAGDDDGLTVSDVWARPAPDLTGSDRSAVYMVVDGGAQDDALVAASVPSDVAGTAEVHETVMGDDDAGSADAMEPDVGMGGADEGMDDEGMADEGTDGGAMMTMREVDSVEVPAGGSVRLEPGGYHVMLLDLAEPLMVGDSVEVTLTFEVAGERTVTAEVREP